MNALLIFSLIMNIMGSFFHIGSPSYSIGFIMTPFMIVYAVSTWTKHGARFPKSQIYLLLFCTIFFIASFIAAFIHSVDDNFRVLKFSFSLTILFIFILSLRKNKKSEIIDKSIFFSTLLIATIMMVQLILLSNSIDHTENNQYYHTPIGPYHNPNDLSIIALIILIYTMEIYQWKYKNILIGCSIIIVFAAASRFAMLTVILLGVLHYARPVHLIKYKKIIPIITVCTITCLLLIYSDAFQYSLLRLYSMADHFSIHQESSESSSALRIGSLIYFLENIHMIGSGSFLFNDYSYFFSNSIFAGGLMSKNPHNFFIEIILLYGVTGIILALLLIAYILKNLKIIFLFSRKFYTYFIILACSLCISSSIINFLPIWIVLLAILTHNSYHYISSYNKT